LAVGDLERLLDTAAAASPADRIDLRDPIAAHGLEAIGPMAGWLHDPKLGPFAVRVMEKIADKPAQRRGVVGALLDVDPAAVPGHVARDIADTLNRISGASKRTYRPGPQLKAAQWRGVREVSPLELRFHQAMLDIFTNAGEATRLRRPDGTYERGYWATYFLRGVRNHGGPEYARQLLRVEGTSDGFKRLKDEGRLDLSMEALVLRPEFAPLFTDRDLRTASTRLKAAGYHPVNG
jgi:hypothetical protein